MDIQLLKIAASSPIRKVVNCGEVQKFTKVIEEAGVILEEPNAPDDAFQNGKAERPNRTLGGPIPLTLCGSWPRILVLCVIACRVC
jgi:hypothetical protein